MVPVGPGTLWWRAVLGAAWLGVSAWSGVTRGGVLLAGHPAHAVLVGVAALVGVILLGLALRDRRRRRWATEQDGESADPDGTPAPPHPVRPRSRWWLAALGRGAFLLVTVVVLGALIYLRPFGASDEAIAAMDGGAGVRVADSATAITLTPEGPASGVGLLFQPGARVDARAYVPMLTELAAQGHLVVIVKQPFQLAFTAFGAPAAAVAAHPEVERWAVGGHSLGGVAASAYARDHPDEVGGLLLWASYPLGSLVDRTDLSVTSVSGTQDALATPGDIGASRADLPAATTYVAVEGAVHAHFGDYGAQPGDGEPGIDRDTAQDRIVEASAELLASLADG